jgi:gliding motility-associated-like protein
MKSKFTYRLWTGLCLLLLMLAQHAQAQFPKYLPQYPVASGGAINTMAQKNNIIYLGGSFTQLGGKFLKYGLVYDNFTATTPNMAFVNPNNGVSYAAADGSGGFYTFGSFTQVSGVTRNELARINADGTLNAWNPQAGLGAGDNINKAVVAGSNVIMSGTFSNFNGTAYSNPIAMLDGTTGKPVSGWSGLDMGLQQASMSGLSQNNLFVFGKDMYGTPTIKAIDITTPANPTINTSFVIDATVNDPTFSLTTDNAYAVSGNRVYLSAVASFFSFDTFTIVDSYKNTTTLAGQAFNSKLFAVDAATGTFVKAFNLSDTENIESVAVDGNTIYVIVDNADPYNISGNPDGATPATSKVLKAFNATTGEDISSSLPALVFDNGSGYIDILSNVTSLQILEDHKLVISGGFGKLNGNSTDKAILDGSTNTLLNWDSFNSQAFSTIAESNGKIYLGGNVSYTITPSVPLNGLGAINATTGEILNWKPADFVGTYNALTVTGNTLYLGGLFASTDGTKTITNLAAYDITDPANPILKTDFKPNPDGGVNTLAVNGSSLFVGGSFKNIGTTARGHLASFDLSSGSGTLTSWNPSNPDNPNISVNAFAVFNNILYVGGSFTVIGTSARGSAAAFDLNANNAITPWNPKISGSVNALAVQPADGTNHAERVFIVGGFSSIGQVATSVKNFGVTNTTDGSPDAWQLTTGFGDNFTTIATLAILKNKLYVGGVGFFNSADITNNVAALDTTHYLYNSLNATAFAGNVKAILPNDGLLFLGGDFSARPVFVNTSLTDLVAFQTNAITPQITFANITKTYGDADATLVATSTNATTPITYVLSAQKDVNGNAATIANITTDGKLQVLMPGTATITASQAASADYTAAPDVSITVTINKAQLTVHPQNVTAVVNQPLADFPFTLTGWIGSDATKTGVVNGKPLFNTTATATSHAGTYDLAVSGAGTLASAYYSFTPSTGKATLTINTTGSTVQTITFPAIATKTYGDADFDPAATTDATGLNVTYKSSDPSVATIVNNKVHIVGGGTVTITASQAGDPTYASAADMTQTFAIAKVPLTIKADDKNMNRGDQLPILIATYTGLVNNDKASNLTTQPTLATTATAGSVPGTYPITASDAASNNYNITYVNGTLTIIGTQIITWAPVSTLTYGDAPFNPGATSDAGAAFMPVYTTSNPAVIAINNGQAVIKGAGTATITASFAAANDFVLTTSTETIIVLKKQLVLTAEDKTRNYGDANPAFTFTYTGFVNSDNATSGALTAQPVGTTTATTTSPVGVYPITVNGATSDNYSLTYINGNLTINAVARILTFNALPAKTYGNTDFNPGASSNTGETPVYTVSDPTVATVVNGQIHLTGAGTTTVTATLPANSSYTGATTATRILTVAKAKLTITADNKTKTQGPPNITLTATYNGFVNNDNELILTAPASLTTTANADSPTGTYPIMVSGASSQNYDITYVNGTLSIVFGVGQDQIVVHPMLSPNGDGKNDFMLIDGIQNYPDNHVLVVNRNGAKVYEARGYDNSSIVFSGKNNDGNSLVAGTYYYEISYSLKGNTQRKTGYIIIKY